MWARQVILAVIGLSSGIAVAGGLFSFIIGLGVVSDLQTGRTQVQMLFYTKK